MTRCPQFQVRAGTLPGDLGCSVPPSGSNSLRVTAELGGVSGLLPPARGQGTSGQRMCEAGGCRDAGSRWGRPRRQLTLQSHAVSGPPPRLRAPSRFRSRPRSFWKLQGRPCHLTPHPLTPSSLPLHSCPSALSAVCACVPRLGGTLPSHAGASSCPGRSLPRSRHALIPGNRPSSLFPPGFCIPPSPTPNLCKNNTNKANSRSEFVV